MQNFIKKALGWAGKALFSALLAPIEEIKTAQGEQSRQIDAIARHIEELHKQDPIAEECDLSILDDRICTLIAACRQKGYTTAEDRRRVNRMHQAYKARGGNHGEENEFAIFCALPTEECFERKAKGEHL